MRGTAEYVDQTYARAWLRKTAVPLMPGRQR